MQSPTRVLLVEDNSALRGGMRLLIRTDRSLELVGEAGDGETAVTLAAELSPAVILMDVAMPGAFDGIEATRRIVAAAASRSDVPPPLVIALSGSDEHRAHMLAAGATAFVPKGQTDDLLTTIKTIVRTHIP